MQLSRFQKFFPPEKCELLLFGFSEISWVAKKEYKFFKLKDTKKYIKSFSTFSLHIRSPNPDYLDSKKKLRLKINSLYNLIFEKKTIRNTIKF